MNLIPGAPLLPTTVVGSYPVVQGGGLSSLVNPLRSAMKRAVEDQISAGIDIISDGQVRGDMVGAFTSRLPGIRGQEVVGKVLPASAPITAADVRYARRRTPLVKGIVTGPTTLAHALHLATPLYRNREELVPDLASALALEARALQEEGIAVLQIDEPILSTGMGDLEVAKKAIAIIAGQVSVPVCLHVCGDLGAVVDDLLSYPVQILDFEFSRNPGNMEIISGKDLGGRMIGFGCVDSASPEVEPADVILSRIRGGVELFGPEQMLVDPDCGLRMHSRDTAYAKLSHMAEAAKTARKECQG
ncbi:5-methyltetrahydropteroyltriglutamate--homocysteine methyltransferase [Methanolinea mesophila]|uniref:methionine synthase n=1 Tax=Methanolinea mesophila TaxID=547055 RepID=UPI001AE2E0A4|nr:methionine synthase [Methanolinea mesophila]MBP1928752.1 5-methyltetrahydropteroyltriglutamate--homocysteine methyltransferase [Methanolinea mesophila]